MNYYAEELIGLDVEVVKSSNPLQKGIKGKIVDESRNMIAIDNGKILKLQKKYLNIKVKDKVLDLTKIQVRPFERVRYYRAGD